MYVSDNYAYLSSQNDSLIYRIESDGELMGYYSDLEIINLNSSIGSHSLNATAYFNSIAVNVYLPTSAYYYEYNVVNQSDLILNGTRDLFEEFNNTDQVISAITDLFDTYNNTDLILDRVENFFDQYNNTNLIVTATGSLFDDYNNTDLVLVGVKNYFDEYNNTLLIKALFEDFNETDNIEILFQEFNNTDELLVEIQTMFDDYNITIYYNCTMRGASARDQVVITISHSPSELFGDSNVTWTILVENSSIAVPYRLLFYQLIDARGQIIFEGELWTNSTGYAELKFFNLYRFIPPPDGNISLLVSINDQDFIGQGEDSVSYIYQKPVDLYEDAPDSTLWDAMGDMAWLIVAYLLSFIPAFYIDKKWKF